MKKTEIKSTMRYAGAFVAWVIGSGFATGQEILQFFCSYGYKSFAVILINLAGFLLLGKIMLTEGFAHKDTENFNGYEYFCGKAIGRFYSTIIPITLALLMSVLISAAGTALNQYYGINRYAGSAIMAALVLVTYLIGFEKMVRIVSSIGPFIIAFAIFVGVFTVFRDFSHFSEIGNYTAELAQFHATPHWLLSGVLYLSLNFFCGNTYYTALGQSADTYRSAKWGAMIGASALILTFSIMNIAILLNAGTIVSVSVPNLYLAQKISPAIGGLFAVVLVLGMFSSCSTMMWSFCSGFFKNDKVKNRIFSIGTIIVCLALGLFPFGKLISIIYPMIGYLGLFYVGCVLVKGFQRRRSA